MRLVPDTCYSRVTVVALCNSGGADHPPVGEREKQKMAKTNHGPLAAAAGTLVVMGLRLTLILTLMLVVFEANPAEATFPAKSGKIAYSGDEGPNADYEIYTIKAGGGRLNVTVDARDNFDPCYSPGGKKIVYTAYDGNDDEIYKINVGGGGRVQLTDNSTDDKYPCYSPSGKKIAYSGDDGDDSEIYTINAGGGGRIQLTNNDTNDSNPDYSPSGQKIAYSGDEGPNADYEIYTINVGGGGRFNVTDNGNGDFEPSWGS